jgi:SAM-dependent methyltransferase
MRRIVKVIVMIAACGLLLCPPTWLFIDAACMKLWPLRILRANSIINGAHISIIVSEACKASIFESIIHFTTPSTTWWEAERCAPADSVARAVAVELDILLRWLTALVSIGLVRESEPGLFCLTALGRYSFSSDGGVDNVCGIAVVSNHNSVISRLGRLSKKGYQHPPQATQFLERASPEENEDLWVAYAELSATFSERIASRVVNFMIERFRNHREMSIIDVGCGSGAFLASIARARVDSGSLNDMYIFFDLPRVIEVAKKSTASSPMSLLNRFQYIDGDAFSSSDVFRVVSTAQSTRSKGFTAVIMNSFLQHLNDSTCEYLLSQWSSSSTASWFVIVELTIPQRHFSPLWEWVPTARTFDVVLSSITDGGRVRHVQDYIDIAQRAGMRFVESSSMFPIPAHIFIFSTSLDN